MGVTAFVKNDRAIVLNNIAMLHGAAAVLAKQPILALSPQEAQMLTGSLCDVLDYHQINICGQGGPYGLYAALFMTAFAVYKPRMDVISGRAHIVGPAATAPASPAEAEAQFERQPKAGTMDFSGAA